MPVRQASRSFYRTFCGIATDRSFDMLQHDILTSPLKEPLVMDFGLSRVLVNSTTSRQRSFTSTFNGTVRWMAVEVVDGARPSKNSHVWASGMILYELLKHEVPFQALRTDIQVPSALQQRRFPDIH